MKNKTLHLYCINHKMYNEYLLRLIDITFCEVLSPDAIALINEMFVQLFFFLFCYNGFKSHFPLLYIYRSMLYSTVTHYTFVFMWVCECVSHTLWKLLFSKQLFFKRGFFEWKPLEHCTAMSMQQEYFILYVHFANAENKVRRKT